MEIETVKFMVMRHVRNFFNKNNSMSEPCDPPPDFILLCEDIQKYLESPESKPSAYTSETVIGVHSYTRGVKADGTAAGWQEIFKNRLNDFRKHTYIN